MKFFTISTLAAVLLFAVTATATVDQPADFKVSDVLASRIADAYIVKLRPGTQPNTFLTGFGVQSADSQGIQHVYDHGNFQGFASKLTPEEVERLRQDSNVESVEPQRVMRIAARQSQPPSWGLTRISQRRRDLDSPYIYPGSAGEDIDVWIIDSGIQDSHPDFEGRATFAKNFVRGEADTDLNGHGTHVAGTVGSRTYGVAKRANLFGVKVLDSDGYGTDADVIAGIQYVAKNARPGSSVVNMSLGGGKSYAIDASIAAAVSAGIPFIVAAGNDKENACAGSPSGNRKVFTVAASDQNDAQASYSNYGRCVQAYAPGTDITSLWKGRNNAIKTISGTSMASPHVAGVAAIYLSTGKIRSVGELYIALRENATPGVIKRSTPGTPNKLIYSLP
ncbi:putative secreted subtilisin-like serine protease [Thamnocephalis sphaerospora]|uniref:Putative secreted subtilisin-like serine protease n=1 Tax=Thamnocephalis sphaerospora TaxID=78915 RepID=A0A4P9XP55_9FUNG|nr:putative secreted subtilisin-like serine protease [Thamnocephalis sphaerospora]|eukprot:RKP07756.1 putative secreted subtilisin-like serine protease [Thamnocephalis sphaerospora]